ncbi:MFS transporter [Chitinophaga oryzae]|uniref:MFS transporter n=1 Tax=Chitinophaga oryzae TaxID=2725414 RepID=A0AAE7DBE8_9BACT|nr:MFS transporter [Chitinophaga oryzae]QJB36030.2 MFS transporter [Chitinophaga oryzae]QJB42531.2 MFS transporter [Chitinophaga oryzae]
MQFSLNKKATLISLVVTIVCVVISFYGSRKLQNFDPALIAYLFATLFALFGIVYRYCVWLQRPPTWMYFKRTWQLVFTGAFWKNIFSLVVDSVKNLLFQQFIYPRSKKRWIAHFMLASGCLAAFAITIPLTLGWIHFTLDPASALDPGATKLYWANFFGFKILQFKLGSALAFFIFHALTWCSWLVIAGAVIFLVRRLTNAGLIASQTFEGDLLPLILLIIISLTGLGLNYSYAFMKGIAYDFMSVTHAISVILFLVWIPFGKFFHIIQRPAQIGAHIYRREGAKKGMAVCPHTGKPFTTQLHVDDLKTVTKAIGFDFTLEDGTSHLDYSPEGKRSLLARAHLRARQEGGNLFG